MAATTFLNTTKNTQPGSKTTEPIAKEKNLEKK
jgi:hypothetical protein